MRYAVVFFSTVLPLTFHDTACILSSTMGDQGLGVAVASYLFLALKARLYTHSLVFSILIIPSSE